MTIIGRIAGGLGVLALFAAMEARQRAQQSDKRRGVTSLDQFLRQRSPRRRKPPESGISVPAIPSRGPLPKQGGAAAPLDFDA